MRLVHAASAPSSGAQASPHPLGVVDSSAHSTTTHTCRACSNNTRRLHSHSHNMQLWGAGKHTQTAHAAAQVTPALLRAAAARLKPCATWQHAGEALGRCAAAPAPLLRGGPQPHPALLFSSHTVGRFQRANGSSHGWRERLGLTARTHSPTPPPEGEAPWLGGVVLRAPAAATLPPPAQHAPGAAMHMHTSCTHHGGWLQQQHTLRCRCTLHRGGSRRSSRGPCMFIGSAPRGLCCTPRGWHPTACSHALAAAHTTLQHHTTPPRQHPPAKICTFQARHPLQALP